MNKILLASVAFILLVVGGFIFYNNSHKPKQVEAVSSSVDNADSYHYAKCAMLEEEVKLLRNKLYLLEERVKHQEESYFTIIQQLGNYQERLNEVLEGFVQSLKIVGKKNTEVEEK